MQMKHILISTLIAAAATSLSLRAETKPLLNDQELPADTKNALPLADAPAAEETQDEADALELLLADDALVELDEAAAPDELSTETMMREWIARYAAAARFAGIRAVKGTGGGLSSGGALATAGAELAVPAATPTPSVSVPAAGTVSLADTLTRASIAADVSLGSASASDAGTPAAVATTTSSSGASAILPAAFFSTRGVFAAVPAATASYSLASSSGVAAASAETTSRKPWPTFDEKGMPKTTDFATPEDNTTSLAKNSIVTFTTGSDTTAIADINTNGYSLQLNASKEMKLGLITGGGAVWINSGYWQATASAFSDAGDLYFLGDSHVQFGSEKEFNLSNNVFLGASTKSFEKDVGLSNTAIRVGVWDSENRTVNLTRTTTILSGGTTIAFQKSGILNISTLAGSGDLNTSSYNNAGANKLNISGASNFTGKITLNSAVELNWSTDSTFGGLSGDGSVAAGSKLNIANAKDGSSFAGTVGAPGKGVALSLTGTGTQAFKGTSYFSTVSVGAGATLDLSGGNVTISSSIQNSGTIKLSDSTTVAIAGGNNSAAGCTDFGNVAGAGRIEFAAVGHTTPGTNNDNNNTPAYNASFSWVKLSENFTGTLSITSGVVDMLSKQGTKDDGWNSDEASSSAIDTSRLGGTAQIELNGGGIQFRNASGTFDKAISVGKNGGAIRLYENGNVTISNKVSGTGTLAHTDRGTLTFTNTVNLGAFSADAGVTVFAGETTITKLNLNGGTVKVTNGTVLDLTNNKNKRTGVWGSSSILMIDGEKSTVKISTGTWEKGTSLGTAYAQSQLQISNGGTLEVTLAQKNEGEYASKRGFSITGGEGTYRYSGTEASYVTHNTDSGQHIGLADGKNSTLIFEVVEAGATLEVTKVVADTSLSSRETDGALKKTGAGTLELKPNDGANNFTGSVTIAEGKLVAGSANALGTGADTNVVKIAGGQLAIAEGVKLAQTNIEIALGDAYKTTNGAAVAAISGANKLASGTTITLSLENEAMNVAAEAAQDSYRIYDGTLANGVTIKLSDSLERLWKLEAVVGQEGVYALVAIPEPSLFGLLAGATALGFSMSSRRRRKKP